VAHRSTGQKRFVFAGHPVIGVRSPHCLIPSIRLPKASPPGRRWRCSRHCFFSIWYDFSGVKLAEALDDRASFRRFCGFSANEATPERTAFVRFRRHWGLERLSVPPVDSTGTPRLVEIGGAAAMSSGSCGPMTRSGWSMTWRRLSAPSLPVAHGTELPDPGEPFLQPHGQFALCQDRTESPTR
jgi:Transposase domain (DUF772)